MTGPSSPRTRKVALPGRAISLLEWGRPDSPPLLLIHGIRDHAYTWQPLAEALAQTHRVIAPDLRGHGDSDWCRAYNLHDYVSDVAGVTDALGLSSLAVVGHSLGGHIALRYVACFPERVACLCSSEGVELPIMRDQRKNPRTYAQRLREWLDRQAASEQRSPRLYAGHAEAKARMAQEHPALDDDTLVLIVEHGLKPADGGYVWKYDNACRHRAPEDASGRDVDDLLAGITCPVLLAYGDASWIPVPPAERLAKLTDYRLIRFPGAGHWLHHEARRPFLSALQAFLAATSTHSQNESPFHA